jgi:hypothetical protein
MNIQEYTDAGLKSLFLEKETDIKMIRQKLLSLKKEELESIKRRSKIVGELVKRGYQVKFEI